MQTHPQSIHGYSGTHSFPQCQYTLHWCHSQLLDHTHSHLVKWYILKICSHDLLQSQQWFNRAPPNSKKSTWASLLAQKVPFPGLQTQEPSHTISTDCCSVAVMVSPQTLINSFTHYNVYNCIDRVLVWSCPYIILESIRFSTYSLPFCRAVE